MKRIAVILALSLFGILAHADNTEVAPLNNIGTEIQANGNDLAIAAPAWVCGLKFTGTARGLKVIIGRFSTVAYGTLYCKGLLGKHYSRNVMITIGHHWLSPTVGIGYFKLAGISSEISLFNCSPDALLGKYKVASADAAIIGGVGSFTAVKVGLPQLAFNVALKLLFGLGIQVGIDKLTIQAI